jgi:antitoxin component YwqK of YwqJK toxin-antitoxin module
MNLPNFIQIFISIQIFLFCSITYAQNNKKLFESMEVNRYNINYPDSSKCFFYYVDSTDDVFCIECFYKNEFRKSTEYLVDGKKNGPSMGWYENGKIEYIENYILDCPVGLASSWYKNGNLKETGRYYFHSNDSLINLNWHKDKDITVDTNTYATYESISSGYKIIKDGVWKYFSTDGKINKTELWEKGRLISEKE